MLQGLVCNTGPVKLRSDPARTPPPPAGWPMKLITNCGSVTGPVAVNAPLIVWLPAERRISCVAAEEIVWPSTLSEIGMPKLGTDKIRRTPEAAAGPVGDPSPPQPNNDADTTTRTASFIAL